MKYKLGFLLLVFSLQMSFAADNLESKWIKKNHLVLDTSSQLMWQDVRNVKYRKKVWSEAKRYCENLTLAKNNNWRLPTLEELLSTVDYTRSSPALVKQFEYSDKAGYYWSSSRVSTDIRYAWYVAIDKGNTYAYSKAEKAFFRCVRDDK